MDLITIYNKYKGVRKLFSEVITLDWYDDTITGICKIADYDQWYICNLCFFDPDKSDRILTLVKVRNQWVQEFKLRIDANLESIPDNHEVVKGIIKKAFYIETGEAYLMRASHINDINYSIVQLPLAYLRYYSSISQVMAQDSYSLQRWKNFFPDKDPNDPWEC